MPAAFATIRAYSPYDNVRAQPYPAMLVLAGLTDPRVTYWEPAKWVARLRRRKTTDSTLVLRINLDAGHAGAPGRFDRLKEVALAYAFAIAAVKDEAWWGRKPDCGQGVCVDEKRSAAVLIEVPAQVFDRGEAHGAVRHLGFDRAVGEQGIGHLVDHAGLEDRQRPRFGARLGPGSARGSRGGSGARLGARLRTEFRPRLGSWFGPRLRSRFGRVLARRWRRRRD